MIIRWRISNLLFFPFVAVLVLFGGVVAANEMVTITGVVGGDGEIVADDGRVYLIAEGEQGQSLVEHEGEAMTVTGTVEEDGETLFINVFSYGMGGESPAAAEGEVEAEAEEVAEGDSEEGSAEMPEGREEEE
ncbi:MAG: hypothetical protein JXD19_09855 [Deltaproteobacteria bacterium]|nr:hypothetical protein [Deltaproteobacteria bacterium]